MRKSLSVFGIIILAAGGFVLSYLYVAGSDVDQMKLTLQLSAWTALLIYVAIFIARPVSQLVKSPFSSRLLRNRRYFGIALAAVMTIHLALLLTVNEQAFNIGGALVFGLMFLMLFTSFDGAAARIGPSNWRILHKVGLYALGTAYASAIGREFLQAPLDPVYLGLTVLMLAAIVIRIMAFLRRQ